MFKRNSYAVVVIVFALGYFITHKETFNSQIAQQLTASLDLPAPVAKTNDEPIKTASKTFDEPPPEEIDSMKVCAEKCKHIPTMCEPNWEKEHVQFPAPQCVHRTGKGEQDPYYPPGRFVEENRNRYRSSVVLTKWGARRARHDNGQTARCEDLLNEDAIANSTEPGPHGPIWNEAPMMWPEEFEAIVKTFAQLRPETYLEWGCGKSTNFYPLLASGKVVALDNYPPWCETVSKSPVVNCLINEQKRFQFHCIAPLAPEGTVIKLSREGRVLDLSMRKHVAESYVNAIDTAGVPHYDIILVDGRYRAACALKALSYINEHSVVFMHDFFARKKYHIVFDYFDIIGYSRSLVILRKKDAAHLPADWKTAYEKVLEIQE